MMPRILTAAAVLLLLVTGVASAQTSDLIITEYVEGSGNNKAIEIYNGTEDQINLGSYAIDRYSNGASSPTSIPLANVDLGPGDTYVVTHDQAEPALLGLADQVDNNLNFNGNDALVLTFGGSQIVDSFGRVGEDPGTYWSCSEGTTQNHTMRRLSSICSGDIDPADLFDPCAEWSFFASDTFSGIGSHIADCGAVGNEAPPLGTI